MFKQKNALIAVAVTVLLAACGGGGGGDSGSGTTPTGSTNDNTGGTNTAPVVMVQDKNVGGFMRLGQVGTGTNLFDYSAFTGTGIYAQPKGTVAPLTTFVIRVNQEQNPTTGADGNGHVALEMMDTAAGTPQRMQFIIDRVNYKIDASGNWTVALASNANMYVSVRNAGGATADMTVTGLPADLVKVTPVGAADPGAQLLTIDVDKAMVTARSKGNAAQQTVLNSLQQFKGTFNMNATYSALDIRHGATPARLAGADITVAGRTVKGTPVGAAINSGLRGKYSVDVDPTAPK